MEEFEEADKKAQLKLLLETKDIELIREAVEEYPPAVIKQLIQWE